jgi:outer membrane immunogenic protein
MKHSPRPRIFSILLSLTLLTSSLSSEEFAICDNVPEYWQGFYVVGQAGAGWNRPHAHFINANYFNTIDDTIIGTHFDFSSSGFVGGGGVGFNLQNETIVFGIESRAFALGISDHIESPFFPITDTFSSNFKYIVDARFRLGWAYYFALPFITAGYAGGNHSMTFVDSGGVIARTNDWINGWTVGIGVDYKIFCRVSFGIEYDFYNLNRSSKFVDCPDCGVGVGFGTPAVDSAMQLQTLTLRIIYHFM